MYSIDINAGKGPAIKKGVGKMGKKTFTDFEIGQGISSGKCFEISASGRVYRRRPAAFADYGCYGKIDSEKDTPENREKITEKR